MRDYLFKPPSDFSITFGESYYEDVLIIIIVNHHELSLTIMNYHESSWIIINHYELSWIIMNYHELSWIIMNYHESSWIIINHHESSLTIINHSYASLLRGCLAGAAETHRGALPGGRPVASEVGNTPLKSDDGKIEMIKKMMGKLWWWDFCYWWLMMMMGKPIVDGKKHSHHESSITKIWMLMELYGCWWGPLVGFSGFEWNFQVLLECKGILLYLTPIWVDLYGMLMGLSFDCHGMS